MNTQISIFDILEDKPKLRLRVHFKDMNGVARLVELDLNDRREIREVLKKCREEHKDLYFQFYEEV